MKNSNSNRPDIVSIAARVVGAYVSYNPIPAAELPGLIGSVHATISGLRDGGLPAAAADASTVASAAPTAAAIRKSVTPDALISFIDGGRYKTLKRHLTAHGLDPRSYRQRFGLPEDYPMVAPNYAQRRSDLAKSIGLGRPGAMAERYAA